LNKINNNLIVLRSTLILFSLVFCIKLSSQSLVIESQDSIAFVNSIVGQQAEGHFAVKNISNSSKDYYLIRRKEGLTGLVDSNFFCWDLCYPTWASQSQGNVTIAAGAVAYDFSGYAYVRDTAAEGQDTVWYTIINATDSNDTLQVQMIYGFSKTFNLEERGVNDFKIYPNPIGDKNLNIDMNPSSSITKLWVLDVNGRKVREFKVEPNQMKVTFNPRLMGLEKGIYILKHLKSAGEFEFGKFIVQ
tara:strand:- start:639 stop:1376 length:738 start_codon:yes stop_codon:yes gene_type:complete